MKLIYCTTNGRHTLSGVHNFVTAELRSSLTHPSSSLPSYVRTAPTILLALPSSSCPPSPNKLSRNSHSAAIAWWTHASISPRYRMGSCACSSMGRGRPEGPPRVNAPRNALSKAVWRVCVKKASASLRAHIVEVRDQKCTNSRYTRE